jgi:hypothetical protein
MKITKSSRQYERWLAEHTPVVSADLALKHTAMAQDPFSFLRATFYRWAQRWPKVCADLTTAPTVRAVGDLHVENFGTWRDKEGRLIWGINDFDEAYPMPYTNDLVRLAVSAHLAIAANHLAVKPKDACEMIVDGYTEGLRAGGRPFVLSEEFTWLRAIALGELRDPVHFWQKMDALPTLSKPIPRGAIKALERLLPERGLDYRVAKRIAGLGSLGHQRFVALAAWRGGKVAREAKALVPSACVWAAQRRLSEKLFYQTVLDQAVRCPDPFVHLQGRWIVRRLAPDCSRIELTSLPKVRDESRLLHAMGWETANIHLGSPQAIAAVRRHLRTRPAGWLHAAAKQMVEATMADFSQWRTAHPAKSNGERETRQTRARR